MPIVDHSRLLASSDRSRSARGAGRRSAPPWLFVDDMSTIHTLDHLEKKFMALYSADFEFTGRDLMQYFLWLEVEQLDGCIKLHLDTYIQEHIAEYQLIRPKFLKPKKAPMSTGLVLETNDCPETPAPILQKKYRSMVAKLQLAAHRIRFDLSYAAAQLARFCASAGPSLGSVDALRWIPRA